MSVSSDPSHVTSTVFRFGWMRPEPGQSSFMTTFSFIPWLQWLPTPHTKYLFLFGFRPTGIMTGPVSPSLSSLLNYYWHHHTSLFDYVISQMYLAVVILLLGQLNHIVICSSVLKLNFVACTGQSLCELILMYESIPGCAQISLFPLFLSMSMFQGTVRVPKYIAYIC